MMSDLPIKSIGSIGSINGVQLEEAKPGTGKGFDSVINEAMSKVTQVQNDVEKAVNELATGGDISEAVLAIEKADMSFQLMVEIRNKLLGTYEEIMRMSI
ncbi:MAG: flagellar hook-basal body complex protein FliE [Nitrospiraceae bacterium]|nr:MAG: flagellar hook-basal body complex protein FliE [Nitrospiraceae bacterium]